MSRLFTDKAIFSAKMPKNKLGNIAKETNEKYFKEWIEDYIKNNKFNLHNIASYKLDPITIISDTDNIKIPFNVFRNSPATISYIDSTSNNPVTIVLQTPSVLYKDKSRKTYVVTSNDLDRIELLDIKCDVSEITVIAAFDTFETFERFINYMLEKFPNVKMQINYSCEVLKNKNDIGIIQYITDLGNNSIDVQFEDYGVLLDNSLTTIEDEDLVTILDE